MSPEEKQAHADLLRKAIDESEHDRQAVADAVGKEYRTVGYWVARTNPTMPSGEDRAKLRRLLGDYDAPGDAVERALLLSPLDEWRRLAVLTEYKRHLQQQAEAG